MSAEVNKRGVILTVIIFASICYILYLNSDEIKSDSAIQIDPMSMNKIKEKFDKETGDVDLKNGDEKDSDPEIGLEVEYVEDYVLVEKIKVFYSYAKSTVKNQTPPRFPVLLLHGAAYDATVWKSLGTLQYLAKFGYFPIAVDLPGFGKTKGEKLGSKTAEFLLKLIGELPNTNRPVIICPSMSGRYALPFVFKFKDAARGIIPIAPVNEFTADDYKTLNLPALIFYGTQDAIGQKTSLILENIPNSKVVKILNGGHPAYLDDLNLFQEETRAFLDKIYDKEKI